MANALGELYRTGVVSYDVALNAAFDKKEFTTKYG